MHATCRCTRSRSIAHTKPPRAIHRRSCTNINEHLGVALEVEKMRCSPITRGLLSCISRRQWASRRSQYAEGMKTVCCPLLVRESYPHQYAECLRRKWAGRISPVATIRRRCSDVLCQKLRSSRAQHDYLTSATTHTWVR